MKVFVIVPAAGLGTRMAPPAAQSSKKKARSKQFKELGGIPILVHTLRKFAAVPAVHESSSLCATMKLRPFAPRSKSNSEILANVAVR